MVYTTHQVSATCYLLQGLLLKLLPLQQLTMSPDKITWSLHSTGCFTAKSLCTRLQRDKPSNRVVKNILKTTSPLKVKIMVWHLRPFAYRRLSARFDLSPHACLWWKSGDI